MPPHGSKTGNAVVNHGAQGVPSFDNVPNGRKASVSWICKNGDLWFFGGDGRAGSHNDLWHYQR